MLATSHAEAGLPFAAKFFLHGSKTRRDAFMEEIAYLRARTHAAILPIFDAGIAPDGTPFYVSQYMATTLERVIAAESSTTFDRLLYASQLSSALAFLADPRRPILHRDLKAANVFVNGRTCLLGDFGMMHRLGAGKLVKTMPMEARTPDLVRYLNNGPEPTTLSDVFSLGVVLYRLFTGEPALQWSRTKTSKVRVDTLYSVGGRYAPQLDDILRKMLEDDPQDRPSAVRLREEFASLVATEAKRRRGFRV